MHIETENRAISQELQALHKLIADNGAFFHPSLKVIEKGGELSLASDLPAQSRDRLIAVPENCLPSIDDYDFSVCDGRILFKQKSGVEPSTLKTKLLEHQINIFNESEKLHQHRQSSIWFNLPDHPELQDHIIKGRAEAPNSTRFQGYKNQNMDDHLLLESFFKTRVFAFKNCKEDNITSLLMPFIDFANHHPQAHRIMQTL